MLSLWKAQFVYVFTDYLFHSANGFILGLKLVDTQNSCLDINFENNNSVYLLQQNEWMVIL